MNCHSSSDIFWANGTMGKYKTFTRKKKKDPSILNYVFKNAEPMSLSEINQRIKLARISTTESDLCQ